MLQPYVVMGNPINHSKSPFIHRLFALQTGIEHQYGTLFASIDSFEVACREFFVYGQGANITLPFKLRAFDLVDQLTERAKTAGAVNTITKLSTGQLVGDNTDGVGLLADLQRLNMIGSESRVLLLGAGGAARGVLQPLLSTGCRITITNRTLSRAEELADSFSTNGSINAKPFADLGDGYDLVINATSTGVLGELPQLKPTLVSLQSYCYDMFYQVGDTPFIRWAKSQQVKATADGLGMLVGQAAEAFYLWHQVMPDISSVITGLKQNMAS